MLKLGPPPQGLDAILVTPSMALMLQRSITFGNNHFWKQVKPGLALLVA